MLTTVVLSGDSKLTVQLETWLRQVAPGSIKTETHSSLDSYQEMLARIAAGPVVGDTAQLANDLASKKIGLFVINVDLITGGALEWIAELQRITKETAPALVEERVPKVLIMAYEGGVQRLEIFCSELVDDLILRPIDKTLMQQKVEFLLTDSPRLNPSFLFRAATEQIIEVGRDIMIEEISEFAAAVSGREPIEVGSFSALHSDVFGKRSEKRVLVRAYECSRHPTRPGDYLTKLLYFGITASQLTNLRGFLRAYPTPARPKPVRTASGSRVATREKMQFLKNYRIALINMSENVLQEANSILEASFKNSVMKSFSSFARLAAEIEKLGSSQADQAKAASGLVASVTGGLLPGSRKLALIMRGKSLELVRYEPALKKNESFLGVPASEWLDRPDQFMSAIEKEDREPFVEFIQCVESGSPGRVFFRVPDASGRVVHFEGVGELEKAGTSDGVSLVRIDLTEFEVEEWNRRFVYSHTGGVVFGGHDPAAFRFDAVLINGTFLQSNPQAWYAKFADLLRNHKVISHDETPPPVFVMVDPKSTLRPEDFRSEGLVDFIYKPLDRRFLAHKFQAVLPGLFPIREPEPNTWVSVDRAAILGHETIMEELAEYGLVIRYPQPLAKGSFLRFFTPLFGEEAWILGRGYNSEIRQKDKTESHRSQFVFFGHSDELLQKIRRWIREDYVAQKDEPSR